MLIASGTEEPTSSVYVVSYEELSSSIQGTRTISADSPDSALDRLVDMVGGGVLSPEEFFDRFKIKSIIKEL